MPPSLPAALAGPKHPLVDRVLGDTCQATLVAAGSLTTCPGRGKGLPINPRLHALPLAHSFAKRGVDCVEGVFFRRAIVARLPGPVPAELAAYEAARAPTNFAGAAIVVPPGGHGHCVTVGADRAAGCPAVVHRVKPEDFQLRSVELVELCCHDNTSNI